MREIKFRGLSLRKDKWVYGQLQFTTERAWISTGPFDIQFEVIPETVGQYTGLKDKNGKDIYEGDIVRMHQFLFDGAEVENELVGVVEYLEAEFGLAKVRSSWFTEYTGYLPGEGSTPLSHFCGLHEESFEVIGNQYENPELLKQ